MSVLPFNSPTSNRDDEHSHGSDPARGQDSPTADDKVNFAGLDLVRALAAVAVVLLHALVPYLKHPMPGLSWATTDHPSALADGVFWSIETFIMPLFLVIAGFLAARTLASKPPSVLVRTRAKRLLRPLLFAVVVLLPLDLYIWVFGWVCDGLVSPVKLKSLKFDGVIDRDLWGLSHLWFLHYLFSYVALFALATHLASTARFETFFASAQRSTSSLARVVFAIWLVGTTTLYFCPDVIWGFQHRFEPVPSKWIYNGCFFVVGLAIAKFDPTAIRWRRTPMTNVAVAVCFLMVTVPLGIWSLDQSTNGLDATQVPDLARRDASSPMTTIASSITALTLAAMTTTTSLMMSLTLVAISLRFVKQIPLAIKYLAAASFWIYLVHHPVVALVHIDLKWSLPTMPSVAKAILALLTSIGVSLLTYEVLVRRTRLGHWLGMSWEFPSTPQSGADQDLGAHDASKPRVLSIQDRRTDVAPPVPDRRAA